MKWFYIIKANKIVYHYSNADFDSFKSPSNKYHGIYFSDKPLNHYGGIEYKCELYINNPLILNSQQQLNDIIINNKEYFNKNKSQDSFLQWVFTKGGYDALINNFGTKETIVYDPSKIKILSKDNKNV